MRAHVTMTGPRYEFRTMLRYLRKSREFKDHYLKKEGRKMVLGFSEKFEHRVDLLEQILKDSEYQYEFERVV